MDESACGSAMGALPPAPSSSGPDGPHPGLRSQLRAYVQPRLAWEVALLELAGI